MKRREVRQGKKVLKKLEKIVVGGKNKLYLCSPQKKE